MRVAWLVIAGCFTGGALPVAPWPQPHAASRSAWRPTRAPCDGFECELTKMTELRDLACACAVGDVPCGTSVMQALEAWVEVTPLEDRIARTEAEVRAIEPVGVALQECLVMALHPPPTP